MPLIDVLRGAISESGDYTRVKRDRIARVNLNGPAVADVIHLVAELVDNASMFSPPHTQVRLSSEDVPNGVTIEIEDRGLGMTDGEFASANALLSDPPEFDVMRLNEKMRLGLFVVSHLAHRHGIRVHLRPSPYGGVQAIVLLPQELISGDRTPLPAGEDTGEDIWEVREIVDRTAETTPGAGRSGRSGKPLLTSVSSPPQSQPPTGTDQPSAPADGSETTESDLLSAPVKDETRPSLPIRNSRISAVPDAPEASPAEEPKQTETVEAGGGRPALPKRRPQENLAPQLATDPSEEGSTGPAAGGTTTSETALDGTERLARLRRNMSAFQQGTDRGRRDGKHNTNDTDKDA
jgi:hypothetical protein